MLPTTSCRLFSLRFPAAAQRRRVVVNAARSSPQGSQRVLRVTITGEEYWGRDQAPVVQRNHSQNDASGVHGTAHGAVQDNRGPVVDPLTSAYTTATPGCRGAAQGPQHRQHRSQASALQDADLPTGTGQDAAGAGAQRANAAKAQSGDVQSSATMPIQGQRSEAASMASPAATAEQGASNAADGACAEAWHVTGLLSDTDCTAAKCQLPVSQADGKTSLAAWPGIKEHQEGSGARQPSDPDTQCAPQSAQAARAAASSCMNAQEIAIASPSKHATQELASDASMSHGRGRGVAQLQRQQWRQQQAADMSFSRPWNQGMDASCIGARQSTLHHPIVSVLACVRASNSRSTGLAHLLHPVTCVRALCLPIPLTKSLSHRTDTRML
jgi:hypothetical protein